MALRKGFKILVPVETDSGFIVALDFFVGIQEAMPTAYTNDVRVNILPFKSKADALAGKQFAAVKAIEQVLTVVITNVELNATPLPTLLTAKVITYLEGIYGVGNVVAT